jgi:hypothetical protein
MSGFFLKPRRHAANSDFSSGTTTDTNRTRTAGSQGAGPCHCEPRNCPLCQVNFTSIPATVATWKWLASQGFLCPDLRRQTHGPIADPDQHQVRRRDLRGNGNWRNSQIESVLEQCHPPWSRKIRADQPKLLERANKIAADEIRIKLTSRCYKSIPCDFTEDKSTLTCQRAADHSSGQRSGTARCRTLQKWRSSGPTTASHWYCVPVANASGNTLS